MSSVIERPDMHEKYYGAQDKHIESLHSMEPAEECELVETRCRSLNANATLVLNMDGDAVGKFGYRNFVFEKPEEIEKICLEIGGQTIDTIYPSLTGDVQFGIFDAIDSLPSLLIHNWAIIIRASCCMAFQYDVVVRKEPITTEIIFSQQQFTGSEMAEKGNQISLNFNHPVSRIRILSTTPILKATMFLTKDSRVPDQIEVFRGNSANVDIVQQ